MDNKLPESVKKELKNAYIQYHSPWINSTQKMYYWELIKTLTNKYYQSIRSSTLLTTLWKSCGKSIYLNVQINVYVLCIDCVWNVYRIPLEYL